MAVEGLWTIEFRSGIGGVGTGVVVLTRDKVLGGDSSYVYTGTYQIRGNEASAKVKVTNYSGQLNSVFGPLPEFSIEARGQLGESEMHLQGRIIEIPNQQLTVFCTKKAPL